MMTIATMNPKPVFRRFQSSRMNSSIPTVKIIDATVKPPPSRNAIQKFCENTIDIMLKTGKNIFHKPTRIMEQLNLAKSGYLIENLEIARMHTCKIHWMHKCSSLVTILVLLIKTLIAFSLLSVLSKCMFQPSSYIWSLRNRKNMADTCLAKPCAKCGCRITGANYHCSKCNTCLCFLCSIKTYVGTGKATCPKCGTKLK